MKRPLLLLLCLFTVNLLFAQQGITVTGKVTDPVSGQPLAGATVQVKGTSQGTQTDVNGHFSVSAPAAGSLLITYLGYEPQEVAINNRTTIPVPLRVSAKQLDQVVVVGYRGVVKISACSAMPTSC